MIPEHQVIYINVRLLILAVLLISTDLYFLILRREDLARWSNNVKVLIYLSLVVSIVALVSSFVPLPSPR